MKSVKKIYIAVVTTAVLSACSGEQMGEGQENLKNRDISQTESSDEKTAIGEETQSIPTSFVQNREIEQSNGTSQKDNRQEIDYSLILSSTAASDVNIEEHRMIVRKADLKFRVHNVAQSTYAIEQIAVRQGGWVAHTNLWSEQLSEHKIKISEDSSLFITRYVVKNTIILRVPYTSLDTTLHSFVPLIDYLDYRIINAEDVTLQKLAEQMKQKRLATYNSRMKRHADNSKSRLMDVTEAERQILLQQERADAAYIEELKLYDNIEYSTISIDIYETEKYEQMMVPDQEKTQSYRPCFTKRLADSLKSGWYIIQEIIIFILRLWGIIVVVLSAYFTIRFVKKRIQQKKMK